MSLYLFIFDWSLSCSDTFSISNSTESCEKQNTSRREMSVSRSLQGSGERTTVATKGEWHKKVKRKVLWFFWGERFGNIEIDSLHWKPYDLSMTFGKSEKSSIYASI